MLKWEGRLSSGFAVGVKTITVGEKDQAQVPTEYRQWDFIANEQTEEAGDGKSLRVVIRGSSKLTYQDSC